MSTELKFAQDIHSHYELYGTEDVVAHVRGLITKRKNAGRTQFLEVLDVTGRIQILLLSENFSEDDYVNRCKSLRKGNIISVAGSLALSQGNGVLSIVPNTPPETIEIGSTDLLDRNDISFIAAGTKIVHARIVGKLENFFRSKGYLEIEPKLLSTQWDGNGLEPLKAEFPGFGHNVFLVPSPLPQLFEALISTGVSSIFSTAKCLSTSYRDVHSSTEAVSIFTVERILNPIKSNARLYKVALECLAELFSATGTALPNVSKLFDNRDFEVVEGPWADFDHPDSGLTIQLISNPKIPVRLASESKSKLAEVDIEKYARIVLNYNGQLYNLAECTAEIRFGALQVLTNTINTEHILSLLSTAPFRSLRTSTFWNE